MRNSPVIITIVLIGTLLSVSLWNANADQPGPDAATVASKADESVEVRLARSHLELANLDLRRAVEGNKQMPNTVSAAFIEKLQLHIAIDKAQLEQCLIGEDADPHQICIRSAEAAVKLAEADFKRKRAVHQRMPTTASALNYERAGVIKKLAQLNLERILALENSESILTHLQWQIDELRHQVLELQMQIAARS